MKHILSKKFVVSHELTVCSLGEKRQEKHMPKSIWAMSGAAYMSKFYNSHYTNSMYMGSSMNWFFYGHQAETNTKGGSSWYVRPPLVYLMHIDNKH